MMKKKIGDLAQSGWHFLVFIWDYCWNAPYLRFLNVGFVNLLFMYGIGIFLDFVLKNTLPTFLIALLISIFYVTFSFAMRKIFIYKTKGDWIKEYLRCYAFYSVSIVVSVLVLWILIDAFSFAFWSAQALSILVSTLFYSLTSRYFAFMRVPEHEEKVVLDGSSGENVYDQQGRNTVKSLDVNGENDVNKKDRTINSMSEEERERFKDIL